MHIHIEKGDDEAGFWVNPVVIPAYNDGLDARTLRHLSSVVEANSGRTKGRGMASSVKAIPVHCDEDSLFVSLRAGLLAGHGGRTRVLQGVA